MSASPWIIRRGSRFVGPAGLVTDQAQARPFPTATAALEAAREGDIIEQHACNRHETQRTPINAEEPNAIFRNV